MQCFCNEVAVFLQCHAVSLHFHCTFTASPLQNMSLLSTCFAVANARPLLADACAMVAGPCYCLPLPQAGRSIWRTFDVVVKHALRRSDAIVTRRTETRKCNALTRKTLLSGT